MKFGKQLEEYQLPEWRGQYLPYEFLKKRLYEIQDGGGARAAEQLAHFQGLPCSPTGFRSAGSSRMLSSQMTSPLPRRISRAVESVGSSPKPPPRRSLTSALGGAAPNDDLSCASILELWQEAVEKEAVRIGSLVKRRLGELRVQLGELTGGYATHCSFGELRVLDALSQLTEGLTRLRAFAELNHAALYKILKKYDKVVGTSEGREALYPRLVDLTGLGDHACFDTFEAEVHQAIVRMSPCQGLQVSPEVARLVAGLGSSGGGEVNRNRRRERFMFFFLGSSSALFMAILVLIWLPPKNEDGTFNDSYFLSSFCVFRVVLSVLLCLWGMGMVAQVCSDNHINHMFILQVDPRCRAGAGWFFGRAAMLTTTWIFLFGMYVIDYKWTVLPQIASVTGFNSRSSWHYVLYPSALLACAMLLMCLPSAICTASYKMQIVRGLWRTALAPMFTVTFGDNLIGDVLTSLAKPLQDIPGSICYLGSHHPQTKAAVSWFRSHGNNCPANQMVIALPLIAALPYIFRALQCARRFLDTKECKHLLNLGKYISSLLVVAATAVLGGQAELVVVISAVATLYAAAWDVRMDWGLGLEEFGLKPASTGTSAGGREPRERRHFKARTYWICTALDVIMRLSWVLSLMPLSLISDGIVQREFLHTAVSAVEIVRRSMWAVLRIENEQVANASGYRALLWVPRVIDDDSVSRRSVELQENSRVAQVAASVPADGEREEVASGPAQGEAAGGEAKLVLAPSPPAVSRDPLLST